MKQRDEQLFIEAATVEQDKSPTEDLKASNESTHAPVIVNYEPLIDEQGEVSGAITSFHDITDRKHTEQTLQASEELYVAVINSLSAQIAVLDGDGKITAINQAWQEFTEKNAGDRDRSGVGVNYLQICRDGVGEFTENASEARAGIESVLRGELAVFTLEYPCHSPDEERWFLLSVTPLRNDGGGAVISHQNITERKKAEAELRETEEFNRSIIKSSPDCIKVLDLEGNLLSMEVGQELLCIDDIGPFLNKPWTELWEGIDRQSAKAAVAAAAAGGNGNFVGFFRTMRGDPKWWNVAVSPILDADGRPARLLAVSRDVTDQKEADEALRKNEWRLRYATESARLTFVEIDLMGGGGALTPENFAAVMGYASPAGQEDDAFVGGRVLLEHVVPDDRSRVNAALHEFFDGKSVGQIDYRVLGDDRIERWIETRWSIELGPDGRPLKSFATCLDITERKQAEAALRNSEDRYRNLFDSMDEGYCIIEMIFDKHGKPADYRYLEVNPSFEKLTGLHGALGKRISEFVPDLEEFWFEVYGKVALTGEPIRVANEVKGMNRWFDIYAFRIGGNDSREVAVLFNNITERKRFEANLAFLADIGQDLARITTVEETIGTIGAKIGAYLDLSLCAFIEINEAEDHATVKYDWHRNDVPGGVGVHRISDFMTEEFQAAGRAGETFIVRDAATDPRTTAESFAAFKIGSMVTVPIIKDGEWQFLMCIYRSEASDWRDDEIALLQELTARIFTRLESARAVTALHKSEQLIRSIYDGAQEYIGLLAPDGTMLEANRAALEFAGSNVDDVVGLPFWETVWFNYTPGMPELVRESVRVAATGEFVRHELSVFKPSGETMTFDFSLYPIRDEHGEVIFIVPEGRDITTRKQAEEALRKSEENFRTLADSMSQLAWMMDADGWIFWFNERWFEYTGTTFEEMQGWGWQSVHQPSAVKRVTAKFKRHISSGEVWEDTFLLRAKSGEYRWFLSRAVPIRDDDGKIVRWFGTNTDIDEVRRAEDILQRSRDELEIRVTERTSELAEANKKLKSENSQRLRIEKEAVRLLKQIVTVQEQERSRIARDLHDELGQQLTALRLKLESAKELCSEEPVCDEIDATQAIAARLDADVGFLAWELRPAALTATGLPATLKSYVNEWSRFSSLRTEFHVKGFGSTRLSPDMEINLYRIVQEGLNNAHKYSNAKNVSILLEKQKYDISLIIEDDGIGFDTDKKTDGKAGLGLIGMRERATLLGGNLEIESSPGNGTTLFVRVPVVENGGKRPKEEVD